MLKLSCGCAFLGFFAACSDQLEPIPSLELVADFGTPENATVQVQDLAAETNLELRDSMVGLDGYQNFLLGNDESVVLIAPSFDCPRPNAESYLVRISITPESPSGKVPAATGELVRTHFSPAIRAEKDLPKCQP
jgi:hypothetical protein